MYGSAKHTFCEWTVLQCAGTKVAQDAKLTENELPGLLTLSRDGAVFVWSYEHGVAPRDTFKKRKRPALEGTFRNGVAPEDAAGAAVGAGADAAGDADAQAGPGPGSEADARSVAFSGFGLDFVGNRVGFCGPPSGSCFVQDLMLSSHDQESDTGIEITQGST